MTAAAPTDPCGCRVHIAEARHDPEWDAFVSSIAGGHHVQTSLWAQAKVHLGWRAVQVRLQDPQLLGGAHVLLRPLPVVGTVAYVPKGPVFAYPSPALTSVFMKALYEVIKQYRVRYIVVQPPEHAEEISQSLQQSGFRPSAIDVMPTATLRIDLRNDLDEIFARARKRTRYNIRRAQRSNLAFQEGTHDDLPTFQLLYEATA